MKSPLCGGELLSFDELTSTQAVAVELVRSGKRVGGVLARTQTAGKGRFQREWFSTPHESLTVSLVFNGQPNPEAPWCMGMALACASARALNLQLQWPNDLVFEGRKVGGILSEIVQAPSGDRIVVAGLGINLNQKSFPDEITDRAASVLMCTGSPVHAKEVLDGVIQELEALPEPNSWSAIETIWHERDQTPGKMYRTNGGQLVRALEVGSMGQLIADLEDRQIEIAAADAVFGDAK